MMIYLTGDTHGKFDRIGIFYNKLQTSRDDILIILGDAGINFHAGALDILRKEYLAKLPITLLCIHGNHERRPESLPYYAEQEWHGLCGRKVSEYYIEHSHEAIIDPLEHDRVQLEISRRKALDRHYSSAHMFSS